MPNVLTTNQEIEMKKIIGLFNVCALAALVLFTMTLQAADDKKAPAPEKIAFDKAPKVVQDAVKTRFPGAEITGVTKEKEGDKIVFDVELKSKGLKYEMDIQEDGTVLEVEKEKSLKEVPADLAKTVEAKFPKSTIKEIMEVNKVKDKKETPDHYELTIETADKKTQEVLVSLDGKKIIEEKK